MLCTFNFFRAFLSQGYAVIFLYRQTSLHPYTRLLHTDNSVLDSFNIDDNGTISVGEPLKDYLLDALKKYKEVYNLSHG